MTRDAKAMRAKALRASPPPRMSRLMIRCLESGEGVPAGMRVDSASFARILGDQTTKCPHCGGVHTWVPRDAWLEDI
jgi:hypothetical protein